MVTVSKTGHPDRMARLLFGTVRREVLSLLYGRPQESFYLREIQRLIGAGIGPVQRELQQLTEAGLVSRQQRGNHVYFSANREAPIFGELQAILSKTTGVTEVLRGALRPLLVSRKVDAAFVYGSVAEGSQRPGSDVDLFLLGGATMAEVVPAVREAESHLGRAVNPTIYSRTDLRKKLKAGSGFLRRVLGGPKLIIAGDKNAIERLAR